MDLRATLCVLAVAAAFAAGLPTDPPAPHPAQDDAPPAEALQEALEAEGPLEALEALTECAGARGGAGAFFACAKQRALAFLSRDVIPLTRDLLIERTARQAHQESLEEGGVDAFLRSHALRVRLPRELREGGALAALVPAALLRGLPAELRLPLLADQDQATQGRGFLKKVVMPFLLGLKFKATALVPLALALIAVKTWKALTLGLLSLVLSAALLIFKFTKPKVVNYEVIHYPHAPPPVVEHPVAMPYDHHHGGYGRAARDAQQMAYGAYAKP